MKSLSRVRLFATPWTVAYRAPPTMGFSRQEYWSGLPFPSPGIFPTQGLNPGLLHCRRILYHLRSPLDGTKLVLPLSWNECEMGGVTEILAKGGASLCWVRF